MSALQLIPCSYQAIIIFFGLWWWTGREITMNNSCAKQNIYVATCDAFVEVSWRTQHEWICLLAIVVSTLLLIYVREITCWSKQTNKIKLKVVQSSLMKACTWMREPVDILSFNLYSAVSYSNTYINLILSLFRY